MPTGKYNPLKLGAIEIGSSRIRARVSSGQTLCLTHGCFNIVSSRGLCRTCYAKAHYLILNSVETWDSLEKAGRAKRKLLRTEPLEVRMRRAITELILNNECLTGVRIAVKIGRKSGCLSGKEWIVRNRILKELGKDAA